ncbi:hypothetical protein HZB89_02560 [archaeon]|nr:hypothetical protein [archaeon]
MISASQCIKCKGRLFCGLASCPILDRFHSTRKLSKAIGTGFQGTNPNSLFISWHNYPNVSIAPLTASEHLSEGLARKIDNEAEWFGLPMESILDFRQSLIRSTQKINVLQASNPSSSLQAIQEIVLARKPVDLEVELKSKPTAALEFDSHFTPMGPKAEQKSISLNENPSIDSKLESLSSDIDVKATTALHELFDYGFDSGRLIKVFSAGLLGVKKDRKLVPTRYSITAVDDSLSKHLLEGIRHYPDLSGIECFKSSYQGNSFAIILVPGSWSFEMLECWIPGSAWYPESNPEKINVIQDNEFFDGRKNYAASITGAYYSARLAVCEYLEKRKRQAKALVFREISQDYKLPLAVWIIRETARNAMNSKPLVFESIRPALRHAFSCLSIPEKSWRKESKLIDFLEKQKTLSSFTSRTS